MTGFTYPGFATTIAALRRADRIAAAQRRRAVHRARAARRAARLRAAEPRVQVVQPRRDAALAMLSTVCVVALVVFTFAWAWVQ